MRQRVMIAMAIANDPALLIADEPTTALDVTIQAQVLDVLTAAQRETDAALLLITHDLGIVAGLADRVVVMYAGRVVEEGSLDQIFYEPRHPYTIGLLESLPRLDADRDAALKAIPGTPPSMLEVSPGCDLAPRCSFAVDECRAARPPLDAVDDSEHLSACFRADELDELRKRREP
jgi:peptide/nickel transport system ATP-binding protein